MIRFRRKILKKRLLTLGGLCLGVVAILSCINLFVFALPYAGQVESVDIYSENSDFSNNEAGAWHVKKSAKWIDANKARITFEVQTVIKTVNAHTDIVMVVDDSGSMTGEKIAKVRSDATELIDSLLSDANNRIALVSFGGDATILSSFTNDRDTLLASVNSFNATSGMTNYYDGFLKAGSILEGYTQQPNRELIMLFLTDGLPNEDTPNEIGQYELLKSKYPYMTINGIQYEMGDTIIDYIKRVSDNQYLAYTTNLNNVLFEASVAPHVYEQFNISDFINDDYWQIDNINSIRSNIGTVNLTYSGNTPKIEWNMDGVLLSGRSAKLTIDISLKDNLILNDDALLPTNKSEIITTVLSETADEEVTRTSTPVLRAKYKVTYEPNLPSDCASYSGTLPTEAYYGPMTTVELSDNVIGCDGYAFKTWEIVEGEPTILNNDYFKILDHDVVIRATWTKVSLEKTMDGTIHEEIVYAYLGNSKTINATFKRLSGQSNATYSTSNTTIVAIKNATTMTSAQEAAASIISDSSSEVPIYAWYNSDDSTIYTYSNADVWIAKADMASAFSYFQSLANIDALVKWDVSNTTTMENAFMYTKITDVNALANWDVSSVTNMYRMFQDSSALADISGLAGWDISNVTNIGSMFQQAKFTNIDALANWNTSSVTNMGGLFAYTYNLQNIDGATNWNTASVTSMGSMFIESGITNINGAANWNTASVTSMYWMFYDAENLSNISGAANWNTSSVTDMDSMFYYNTELTDISALTNWNTSSVTVLKKMFYNAGLRGRTSLAPLEGWDTTSVTDMSLMFYNIPSSVTRPSWYSE